LVYVAIGASLYWLRRSGSVASGGKADIVLTRGSVVYDPERHIGAVN